MVLVDQSSEDTSAPDPLLVEIWGGMIGAWREQLPRTMWPPAVVVSAVLGKDGPQVPFTEEQDAVGELGAGCQHESFGEPVRLRTPRWNRHGVGARVGEYVVEGSVSRLGAAFGGELVTPCPGVRSDPQPDQFAVKGPAVR